MMPTLSKLSLARLATCDTRIQDVIKRAITRYDFIVLCGHRGKDDQNRAFNEGKSRLRFPYSKHNSDPSHAVDLAPFPLNWDDAQRFDDLAKIVLEEAAKLQVPLVWGGTAFPHFVDKPHYEIR